MKAEVVSGMNQCGCQIHPGTLFSRNKHNWAEVIGIHHQGQYPMILMKLFFVICLASLTAAGTSAQSGSTPESIPHDSLNTELKDKSFDAVKSRALGLFKSGDLLGALQLVDEYKEKNNPDALALRAYFEQALASNYSDMAESHCRAAIAANPQSSVSRTLLVKYCFVMGRRNLHPQNCEVR